MVNYCGKFEGCKVFVFWKFCFFCVKFFVQLKVFCVFYLLIELELENEGEIVRVDNFFKNSFVG